MTGTRLYSPMATVPLLPASLVTDVRVHLRMTAMRTARPPSKSATRNTAVDLNLPREPAWPICLITRRIRAQAPVNRPNTLSAGRLPENGITNPLSLHWRTNAAIPLRPFLGHRTIRTPHPRRVPLSVAPRMLRRRPRTKRRARIPRESHQNAKSRDRTIVWRAPARPTPRSSCRTAPRSLRV